MKRDRISESFNYSYEDAFMMEDLQVRHLYLNGDVDENVVNSIIYHIIRFNYIDKGKSEKDRIPIILYINSPGGSLTDGFALVDAISVSKTPIYTVNIGLAASAACFVFMAGKKRFSMPRSEFLIHEATLFEDGHLSKIKDSIHFIEEDIGRMICSFVLDNSSITSAEYHNKERVEWYMLPDEAKKNGIVDYIIGTDCEFDAVL